MIDAAGGATAAEFCCRSGGQSGGCAGISGRVSSSGLMVAMAAIWEGQSLTGILTDPNVPARAGGAWAHSQNMRALVNFVRSNGLGR